MQNLEAGPALPHPISVETNQVSFVIGNSSSPSDGDNRDIRSVGHSEIFNPGDTIQIHNLDGSSFVGIITQIGSDSLTLDAPLPLTVKPGAAILKVMVMTLAKTDDLNVLDNFPVELFRIANSANGTGLVHVLAEYRGMPFLIRGFGNNAFPVTVTIVGQQTSKIYLNNALITAALDTIMFEVDPADEYLLFTANGSGVALYAATPTVIDSDNPLPVELFSGGATLNSPNAVDVREASYGDDAVSAPALSGQASVSFAAATGLGWRINMLAASFSVSSAPGGPVGQDIILLDGSTQRFVLELRCQNVAGDKDKFSETGLGILITADTIPTFKFSAGQGQCIERVNMGGTLVFA